MEPWKRRRPQRDTHLKCERGPCGWYWTTKPIILRNGRFAVIKALRPTGARQGEDIRAMGSAEGPETPIRLFYSYSHRDEELRKKLEDHLAALRWSGMIVEWHDRNIDIGDEWAKEIDRNLSSADIILLLVSASFIASAYCWSVEVKKALERHDKSEAKVIPVILRPCSWHITPFAKLQAAPTDAKPVTSWSDQEAALYDVARKIERAVTDLRQQRRRAAEQRQREAEESRKRAETEARRVAEERQPASEVPLDEWDYSSNLPLPSWLKKPFDQG